MNGASAPIEASTLTPGEASAFIITTDHSPERTFQSSGRPSTDEAVQNVWAAGMAGRASPACRLRSIVNGSTSRSVISSCWTWSR